MNALSKEEIKRVIDGKGNASRVPILYDIWIGANAFENDQKKRDEWLVQYPMDVAEVTLNLPDIVNAPKDDPDYRWTGVDMVWDEERGFDNRVILDDWESDEAEIFFEKFPSPEYPGLLPEHNPDEKRYTLVKWWYCFFERLWSIRGMENALTDFYLYPEQIHKLFRHLTDFYMRMMERACAEMPVDGFFVSDDIGTQNAPFFSLEIFREFFKPYYKELIDKAHSLGAHFWLHTCGNIELFLPEFIEIGLDVIHPIQKGTMDEQRIAKTYGKDICFWVGFDVQQTIPFGTPEDVKAEVRYLIDTFKRDDGRFMLTMGNGSTPDWKLDSLKALYDETIQYGTHDHA